jgi:hypothetical protein
VLTEVWCQYHIWCHRRCNQFQQRGWIYLFWRHWERWWPRRWSNWWPSSEWRWRVRCGFWSFWRWVEETAANLYCLVCVHHASYFFKILSWWWWIVYGFSGNRFLAHLPLDIALGCVAVEWNESTSCCLSVFKLIIDLTVIITHTCSIYSCHTKNCGNY